MIWLSDICVSVGEDSSLLGEPFNYTSIENIERKSQENRIRSIGYLTWSVIIIERSEDAVDYVKRCKRQAIDIGRVCSVF